MPVVSTLVMHFVLGLLVARAAARELRASPRSVRHTHAFTLLVVHLVLVALPAASYPLVRMPDWSLSYLVDGPRVPSIVTAAMILLHAATCLGGFVLGARWVRDHQPNRPLIVSAATMAVLMVALVVFRHRVTVVATALQIRAGDAREKLWESPWLTTVISLGLCWLAGAVHLAWRVQRVRETRRA